MVTRALRALSLAIALTTAASLGSVALAAGPGGGQGNGNGSTGRGQTDIVCPAPIGTITVATANPDNANSAAQIVGANGHFILSSGTFTITDVTTGEVIDSEPFGHGTHPNQGPTVECTADFGTFVAGSGPDVPPGVDPADVINASITVEVIPKLK